MNTLRSLLLSLLLSAGAALGGDELPLFDGHIHYNGNAWDEYPVATALKLLDQAGIKKALLSSTPNDGTLKLVAADRSRFIAELRVYRKTTSLETWYADRATWWRDPELPDYLQAELKRGSYRGIGEFHLNGKEAETDVIRRVVELAVANDLILHAHSDAAAIERLFAHDAKARVLWAHAGITTPIETIERWLERFPNLWVELSYRYDVADPEGALAPSWRALFLRFPDRFVVGSDTWTPSRWPDVPALAVWHRKWLAQLPSPIARQIAYQTGEKLYRFRIDAQ